MAWVISHPIVYDDTLSTTGTQNMLTNYMEFLVTKLIKHMSLMPTCLTSVPPIYAIEWPKNTAPVPRVASGQVNLSRVSSEGSSTTS